MTHTEIRNLYNWRKLTSPVDWSPSFYGEELVGYYGGLSKIPGEYGVILIRLPMQGSMRVYCPQITAILDLDPLAEGCPIRIVWKGAKTELGSLVNDFDVYVSSGVRDETLDLVEPPPPLPEKISASPKSAEMTLPAKPAEGTLSRSVLDWVQENPGAVTADLTNAPQFRSRELTAKSILPILFKNKHLRRSKIDNVWAYWSLHAK